MRFWLIGSAIVAVATWFAATAGVAAPAAQAKDGPAAYGWSRGLVIFGVCCAVLGLTFRLVGLGASLWTDEFGTLWAVEGDLATAFARSQSFHGQSPLYYSIVWLFVQLFGESEIVLRLPSLLFSAAAGILMYKAGSLLMDIRCGVLSAALFWLSMGGLRLMAEARPYALAIFFTALVFHGFFSATRTGKWKGRALFVLGGAGLVAAHYVLAVILLGVGASYLVFEGLRRNYSIRKFGVDVLLQVVLSAPAASQLIALWRRKSDISWIDGVDLESAMADLRPELVLLVAAAAAAWTLSREKLKSPLVGLCAICAVTPPLVLTLLAQAGTNLVTSRYIFGVLVPLCLLTAYCVLQAPLKLGVFGWLGWGFYSLTWLGSSYSQAGSLSGLGRFDWRTAVARMADEVNSTPRAPVLYRSGFIEDDLALLRREVPEAVWAPLRSPGQMQPRLNTIPVSHNWVADGREEYFRQVVKPAIAGQQMFYYLSCDCSGGPRSVRYGEHLALWVARELPQFTMAPIPAGAAMVILKFKRDDPPPAPRG